MDTGAARLIFDHELQKIKIIACVRQENTRCTQANVSPPIQIRSVDHANVSCVESCRVLMTK